MNEFLKKLSELINAKNLAYQNNRQQFADEESDTASTPDTYNPPEVNVPTTQPATTPVSTNTQTPKTTQTTSPITKTTNNTVKNSSIPSSAKNSSQAAADPKSGEAGAKALKAIQASDPTVYIKKNKFLAEAYNAGFYGTDITREIRDNARAGGYLEQIEAMINAGKQDSKGSPPTDESKKSDNGLSTEAARHEQILRMQNIKQAKKLAHTSDDSDDITTEGARKEKFIQKKIDNLKKSGYNSGDTTGNNNSKGDNGISLTAGSALIDFDEVGKDGYKLSDVSFYDEKAGKNIHCVVYANNRAREYWGIEGYFGITEAVSGFGTAKFLEPHHGSDMQTLIDMPSHSLAFFGPTSRNWRGHEVFIEGKDDKYIYFSESNYGDAPTNGKVQRMTYENFRKRGGGFIGYALINIEKYKELYGD